MFHGLLGPKVSIIKHFIQPFYTVICPVSLHLEKGKAISNQFSISGQKKDIPTDWTATGCSGYFFTRLLLYVSLRSLRNNIIYFFYLDRFSIRVLGQGRRGRQPVSSNFSDLQTDQRRDSASTLTFCFTSIAESHEIARERLVGRGPRIPRGSLSGCRFGSLCPH